MVNTKETNGEANEKETTAWYMMLLEVLNTNVASALTHAFCSNKPGQRRTQGGT